MAWAPDYATTVELRDFLRVADDLDDAVLAMAITAASRSIDKACNRQFGSAVQVRIYTPYFDKDLLRQVVDVDDLVSVTAVAVDTAGDAGFATPLAAYQLRPLNAAADGRPFTSLSAPLGSAVSLLGATDSVRVSGTFGWAAVPATIKQATLLQASRLVMRRDSPFGVAGSPAAGAERVLAARVDPDVAVLVRTLYRWWGAV